MDGRVITEARTAAGAALSARLLARDDARVVAIVGTGAQAHAHARALARDPRVERIVLVGRRTEAAEALAARVRDELAGDGPAGLRAGRKVEVEVAASAEDACAVADIVCCATHAAEPVVRRAWLRPGTHVTSVGFNTAGEGEVDGETVRDAVLIVESRSAAFAPPPTGAIELAHAVERGIIGTDHARAEIGELVAGDRGRAHEPGRADALQVGRRGGPGRGRRDARPASRGSARDRDDAGALSRGTRRRQAGAGAASPGSEGAATTAGAAAGCLPSSIPIPLSQRRRLR